MSSKKSGAVLKSPSSNPTPTPVAINDTNPSSSPSKENASTTSTQNPAVITTATASAATTTNASLSAPSPIENALDFWRTFDLNGRRAELDTQGLAIADRQEASGVSRKQLSSDTRNFRRSLTDGTPISSKDVGTILRSYQGEIDSLTNRSKQAETSFISLYKALYDAPDPVEVLSQAIRDSHVVLQLQEQIKNLRDERGDLFERSANTNTLEKKIQDLQLELSNVNKKVKDEAQALLDQEQSQWIAAQKKTIEGYELREQELLHQIHLSNDNNKKLQNNLDESKQALNDIKSELQHLKSTRASVNDMAVEDLERTRAEANSLRRRCQVLENRLAGKSDDADDDLLTDSFGAGGNNMVGSSALSAELAARDVQISQLKDQVSTLEEVLGGKDTEKRNEFAKLSSSIMEKDNQITQMRQKLDKLPTIEEHETMKRQFETLQSFQMLDAMEVEVANKDKEANADGDVDQQGKALSDQDGSVKTSDSLEKRLLNKVKALEGRLTKLRVELTDRDSNIIGLRNTVRTYEDQIADQKSLISKLEDGINAITGENGGMHALKRRAAAASKGDQGDSDVSSGAGNDGPDGKKNDDEDESAWDWGEKHQAEGLQTIISEEPSMLDIIAGQRDRFRARTLELEEDNKKLMERVEKVTTDVDSLKNDNVKLYEKLRFVQSYRQSNGTNTSVVAPAQGVAAANRSVTISNPPTVEISVGDEEDGAGVLGKYRSMYEDMVNPYTIFNRRERHKRISEMSAPERLTLKASQKALATKTSRLLVFFYIISLHVLVALVIGFSSTMCETESITTKATHQA